MGHLGKVDTVHLGGDIEIDTVASQVGPWPHTVTENPRLGRNTSTTYVHSKAVHHPETHLVHGVPAEVAGHRGKVGTVHHGGDVDTATVAGQGRPRPSTEQLCLKHKALNSITDTDNMSLVTNNCSNKPENKEIVKNTIMSYFKPKDGPERGGGWGRKEKLHPARGNRDGSPTLQCFGCDCNVLDNVRKPRKTADNRKPKLSWGSATARKVKGQPSMFKFLESKSKAQKNDKIEEVVTKNTFKGEKRKRDTVGDTKTTGFNPKRSKLTNSNTSKLGKTIPQGAKISFPGTKLIKEFFSNVNPDMGTLWKGEISNLPAREIKE